MALPARMPAVEGEGGLKHLGFVSHILDHGRWSWAILGSRAAWRLGGPLRKVGTHPTQKISKDFNCGCCPLKRKGCFSSSWKDGVPVSTKESYGWQAGSPFVPGWLPLGLLLWSVNSEV